MEDQKLDNHVLLHSKLNHFLKNGLVKNVETNKLTAITGEVFFKNNDASCDKENRKKENRNKENAHESNQNLENPDEIVLSEFTQNPKDQSENQDIFKNQTQHNLITIKNDSMFRNVIKSSDYSVSSILKSIRYNNTFQKVPISKPEPKTNTSKFIFRHLYSDVHVLKNVSGEDYVISQQNNPFKTHKSVPKSCDMFIALENDVIFCHSVVVMAFSNGTCVEFFGANQKEHNFRYLPIDFISNGFEFSESWAMVKYMYTGRLLMNSNRFEKFNKLVSSMISREMSPLDEAGEKMVDHDSD